MVALDATTSMWVVGIIGLLLGVALGTIVTYVLASRNNHTHQ